MLGADLDEMASLAQAFDHGADQIKRIEWFAGARLFVAGWVGADVDDVRHRWNAGCRQGLRLTAESLSEAAQHIRENAEQQRRASDAGWYYARSITNDRGLRDRWNDIFEAGKSILEGIADTTGDLIVGVGSLIGAGISAAGQAFTRAGERVVDAVEWIGECALDVAGWAGGVVAGVSRLVIEKAVDLGVWAGRTAIQIIDKVREGIAAAWTITKWAAQTGLLLGYDIVARADGPLGEMLEHLAGAVPADTVLSGSDQHLSVSSIYENIDALKGQGHIEIQSVVGPEGQTRYIVYIPGTQVWVPGSNNPADVMSDLEYADPLGAGDTPLSIAVEKAMVAYGVPPGAEIILAGHSLGGLTAVQLSRDADFSSRYSVQAVFTAGAGTDSTPPPPNVRLEALRHTNDIVSTVVGLSSDAPGGIPGQHEHWSEGAEDGWLRFGEHDMSGYLADAERLESSGEFAETEQALRNFFGPEASVGKAKGYEARKLTFIGDDPRISARSQLDLAAQWGEVA